MHIRGFDSSKSTGIDGIPIKYLKMAATVITPKLTQLFNICIKKGYFPQALKIAEIVPRKETEKITATIDRFQY